MSKNTNEVLCWDSEERSEVVPHWDYCEGEWTWYSDYGLSTDDVFCLNDADHPPEKPPHRRVSSLEGLIES